MCGHPLHTALRAGGDALRQAADSLSHHPLSMDSLRCAVRQTRQLTAELATLADTLADHTQTLPVAETVADPRPGSAPVDQTMREIVEDLRTMARHLNTSDLLLEPADDDLTHLRPPVPATPATPAPGRAAAEIAFAGRSPQRSVRGTTVPDADGHRKAGSAFVDRVWPHVRSWRCPGPPPRQGPAG